MKISDRQSKHSEHTDSCVRACVRNIGLRKTAIASDPRADKEMKVGLLRNEALSKLVKWGNYTQLSQHLQRISGSESVC